MWKRWRRRRGGVVAVCVLGTVDLGLGVVVWDPDVHGMECVCPVRRAKMRAEWMCPGCGGPAHGDVPAHIRRLFLPPG